ncbi:uncharacterized protein LOC122654953 [Telopea speciosissima]|uniref:uncharacterized protein LOC122654953 n=1 Tax=Telopea speciosissima TaxID=54955 RepID=UPI001CC68F6A|nr:uncharacterized protein LOC122654953 [Telopea speciosissima]
MTKFISNQTQYKCPLNALLKKNPPTWSSQHTVAVKHLKAIAQKLPPLQILSTGLWILQTDASDTHWAAVLPKEKHGKRHVYGYRSAQFKPSEQHYHSTFKEILAVRRGIEKFQFYLIGHTFQVEMDISSFPRMLQFKQKTLLEPQLLSCNGELLLLIKLPVVHP